MFKSIWWCFKHFWCTFKEMITMKYKGKLSWCFFLETYKIEVRYKQKLHLRNQKWSVLFMGKLQCEQKLFLINQKWLVEFIGELYSKQNLLPRMNILFGQKNFYVDSMLIMIMKEDSLDCLKNRLCSGRWFSYWPFSWSCKI